MNTKDILSRRVMLKTAGVAAVGATAQVCSAASTKREAKKAVLRFANEDFYDAQGAFKPEAGKDAYLALMAYHGYPVFPDAREKLWVSDYGTGQFTKLGLGANMFVNDEQDRYMVMDLFLLPNQMLPEHYHLATDKHPAKMEGWVVRHGLSYVYGEGEPTANMKAVVPACHMNGTVSVSHEVILRPGQFAPQVRATARHWQYGGPEGAIITEVANVHDDSGVRHSDTNLVFP